MKTYTFLAITLFMNLVGVLLQIHKQSMLVTIMYERKGYMAQKDALYEQKKILLKQIAQEKSPETIKKHVEQELGFKSITHAQVRYIHE
jgi:hypothetical protein